MLFITRWRRNRIARREFPREWAVIIERNVPVYEILPVMDQAQLLQHVLIFLAEKQFQGCNGLEMTDEIRLTIAAQACILLLGRRTNYYPGLRSILVYPHSYIGRHAEYLESGFIVEGPEERLGEAWHRGPVILSWDDVRRGAADFYDGQNVVFHEFAHQIDSSSGKGDSSPVLQHRSDFAAWARVLRKEYKQLRKDVEENQPTFLDEYGASSPSEFFAVITEYFFEKPGELEYKHPDLYNALKQFYQQDPARLWNW
ncbi:MAG: M90 family metallopeptidase [Phycisphaerae bacterium]